MIDAGAGTVAGFDHTKGADMQAAIFFILALIWSAGPASAAEGAELLDIRQTEYSYRMAVTQDVTRTAFVIARFPSIQKLSPPATSRRNMLPGLSVRLSGGPGVNCESPVIHFALGSAKPLDFGRETLIALYRCGATAATPLTVTGYTCDLGPDALNVELARQRAESVAALLAAQGFKKIKTIAAGATGFATSDPDQRHLNRRVEIEQEDR